MGETTCAKSLFFSEAGAAWLNVGRLRTGLCWLLSTRCAPIFSRPRRRSLSHHSFEQPWECEPHGCELLFQWPSS